MISLGGFYLYVLVFWAFFMSVWGFFGFIEYLTGKTFLIVLQNSMYPSGVQFVHWFLIFFTGVSFLIGYFKKLKVTPFVMVLFFSNLAVLCTIETFDFMSEQWGVEFYLFELLFYFGTSYFLLKSKSSKKYFGF